MSIVNPSIWHRRRTRDNSGHPDCHGSFYMAGPTGTERQRGEGTGCSWPRTRRSNNKGGWTPQLPNSLEARSRASETEPDRLVPATDWHWIHAASARASSAEGGASRARVSDSSQARSEPTGGHQRGREGSLGLKHERAGGSWALGRGNNGSNSSERGGGIGVR